jgi:alkylhydroperoxidase family enzyme
MPLPINQSAIPLLEVQDVPTHNTQDPFLAPIDKPKGLMMKFAYYLTRRKFGKVPGPIKIFSVRLPAAFGMFYGKIGQLDKKLRLPREIVFLIREQVARLNICLFSDAERAVLDYVTELTTDKKVQPSTFAHMSRFYSEHAICEIVWLIASEHLYNLTNLGLNIHSDMLCDINRKRSSNRPANVNP